MCGSQNKSHRKELVILFFSLFLVMVGFGIIIPILPFYVVFYQGNAISLGFILAAYSAMQFFFAPFWGRLSDRTGRRPVFLIGLAGYGITFILFGLASNLWMLFFARLLSGVISSAAIPTAMAYVADITDTKNRAKGMGLMGSAMGLGMIFGPAIGGWLGHFGLSLPFYFAGGLALLTLPFAFFLLPESLTVFSTEPVQLKIRFGQNIFKHQLIVLFILAFVISFTMAFFESTFAYFSAARIGFGPKDMGYLFAVLGLVGVAVQMGLVGRLVNRIGDTQVIKIGLLVTALGFLLLLWTPNLILFVLFAAILNGGISLLRPSVTALVTKVTPDGTGESIGFTQSFDSLGRVCGPILGGILYNVHLNLPYIVVFFLLIGVILLIQKPLQKITQLLLRKQNPLNQTLVPNKL